MDRHETWAQGSKPGDMPLEVITEEIEPERLRLEGAFERLQRFNPKTISDANVRQVITDLLTVFDLEDDESTRNPSPISDAITSSFYERLKRVFHHAD